MQRFTSNVSMSYLKRTYICFFLFTNQSFIFATQLLLELSILYSILNYFVHNATQ